MLFAAAPAIIAALTATTATTAATASASLAAAVTNAPATATNAISAHHQRSEFLVLRWQVVLRIEIEKMTWVGEGVGRS